MRLIVAGTIVPFALAASAFAAGERGATLDSQGDGLQTATFHTLNGTVTANLPEQIVAGDTLSGTVVARPSGDNDKKQEKNRSALAGYVFELDEHPRQSVGDGRLTLDVPRHDAAGAVRSSAVLVLRELRRGKPGREVGRVEIPLLESAPAVSEFRLPTLAQQDVPLRIPGPFDGDIGSSALRVGDVDLVPLAESPRGAIFRPPHTFAGVAPVRLSEGGETVAEGELRNVGLLLSAPKLKLSAGETITVTTRVIGLENLDEEIPLRLRFWPPAIVSVDGGYDQAKTVRPQDAGPDGSYSIGVRVTGVTPGDWGVSARLRVPEPDDRVVERYLLVLEGRTMGEVEVDGDLPRTAPVAFRAGLGLRQPFYDWMQSNFAEEAGRKNGAIVGVDRNGSPVAASEFRGALLEEVALPAFDVEQRSPAHFAIRLETESVRYEKRAGHKKLDVDGIVGPKSWQCSNFRFELGDLPLDRVSKIDSFKWQRKVAGKEPAAIETQNLTLHVSLADTAAWEIWHRSFLIEDPASSVPRLIFLGADGEHELGALDFHDATFSSLEIGDAEPSRMELQAARITLRR